MASVEGIKELNGAFYATDNSKCAELTQKTISTRADLQELLEKNLIAWTKDNTGGNIFNSCQKTDGIAPVRSHNALKLRESQK